MPRRYLIIDGYNLMHALGMARTRYGPGDLERCRNRFVRHVAGRLDEDERSRTTIVFDANDPYVDRPREATHDGLRIVFAPTDSDADTVIEDLIARHSAPKQLAVVSSDRRLRTAIHRRRGTAITSDAFAEELSRRAGDRGKGSAMEDAPDELLDKKRGADLTPEETAAWLEEFGESG